MLDPLWKIITAHSHRLLGYMRTLIICYRWSLKIFRGITASVRNGCDISLLFSKQIIAKRSATHGLRTSDGMSHFNQAT